MVRWLSALPLAVKPRLVTTAGEFHAIRRQLARLAEERIDIVRVAPEPVATLAERLAAEIDGRTAAVLASAVFFETARIVPGLGSLAEACMASHTGIDRSGPATLASARESLGLTEKQLELIARDAAKLEMAE